MSIEFFTTPSVPLSEEMVVGIKADLIAEADLEIVRDSGRTVGIFLRDSSRDVVAQDDLTVSLMPDSIYVAFHFATRTQRESFLALLKSILARHGVSGELVED